MSTQPELLAKFEADVLLAKFVAAVPYATIAGPIYRYDLGKDQHERVIKALRALAQRPSYQAEGVTTPCEPVPDAGLLYGMAAAQCAPQPSGEQEVDEHLWGRFVNHYWDSLEDDKAIVLLHVRAVLDYHAANATPASAVSSAAREALETIARTTFSGSEMDDAYMRGNRDAHATCAVLARTALLALPAAGGEASKREADLRETLRNIRDAITEADPAVLCCTLWMPNSISPAETAVDHIDAALAVVPDERGTPRE